MKFQRLRKIHEGKFITRYDLDYVTEEGKEKTCNIPEDIGIKGQISVGLASEFESSEIGAARKSISRQMLFISGTETRRHYDCLKSASSCKQVISYSRSMRGIIFLIKLITAACQITVFGYIIDRTYIGSQDIGESKAFHSCKG